MSTQTHRDPLRERALAGETTQADQHLLAERLLAELPDRVTDRGRELTLQIAPVIAGRWEATRPGTQKLCSAICAEAEKLKRLAVAMCNEGDDEAGTLAAQEETHRAHVAELVAALPWWAEDGYQESHDPEKLHRWGADCGGDPRGAVVKLTGPRDVYDSFGGDGVVVPTPYI